MDRHEHVRTRRSKARRASCCASSSTRASTRWATSTFNPTARPGDAEWRVLYIGCGDGGSGESRAQHPHESAAPRHARRQDPAHRSRSGRASAAPARSARTAATAFRTTIRSSSIARARARRSGPTVSAIRIGCTGPSIRRMPRNNRLIANSIGLHTWETVNIVHKGANYGYSQREGNEALQARQQDARPLPDDRQDSGADQRHRRPTARSRRPIRSFSTATCRAAATRSAAASFTTAS